MFKIEYDSERSLIIQKRRYYQRWYSQQFVDKEIIFGNRYQI